MAKSTAAWSITPNGSEPKRLESGVVPKEWELEEWIERKPELLESGFRVLARQLSTDSGPLDLLGLDRSGDLVVVELKRDQTYRGALAQVIDYTATVRSRTREQLAAWVNENRHARQIPLTFDEVLQAALGTEDAKTWAPEDHACRMVLAGQGAEPALKRMIDFLAATHNVPVGAVVFDVYAHASELVIVRSEIIAGENQEDTTLTRGRGGYTNEQLLSYADEQKTRVFVEPVLEAWRSLTTRAGRAERRHKNWTLAWRKDGRQVACRLFPWDDTASDSVAWLGCDIVALAADSGKSEADVQAVLAPIVDSEGWVKLSDAAQTQAAVDALNKIYR